MKFSDFGNVGKEVKKQAVGVPVQGAFACFFCTDEAEYAEYYPNEKALSWVCSFGHTSTIEDYLL